MGYCTYCGVVDDYYDENASILHETTPKHKANVILHEYKNRKEGLSGNRLGVYISCDARYEPGTKYLVENSIQRKIVIHAVPNQKVKFFFNIKNETREHEMLIVGVQKGHPQPQFQDDHPFEFGGEPFLLKPKCSAHTNVTVTFQVSDIGQYEMPIMFTFQMVYDKKNIIIIREMVVLVEETPTVFVGSRNPYTNKVWDKAEDFVPSTVDMNRQNNFKIPPLLKTLLPRGVEETALDNFPEGDLKDQLRELKNVARSIFLEGVTEANYMMFFHYLLWWEEVAERINLRKYNMSKVTLDQRGPLYILEVPGLAEKRPSLLRGDDVYIRPCLQPTIVFASSIKNTEDNNIQIQGLDDEFEEYYSPEAQFEVRFMTSRVPMERMHEAVHRLFDSGQLSRIFPAPVRKNGKVKKIKKFYNPWIEDNEEQKLAVEHIISKSSGTAPYMVFGPPGTGKTMTIVEAIVQLVARKQSNRIMVCTDSNMAADHIALALLKYNKKLNINNFLLRANSQNRTWSVMPSALIPVSNGSCFKNFYPISNAEMSMYRVVVTTLLHAAKFGCPRSQMRHKVEMTHLFIDEAAQASEPAALIPITGLLARSGCLVLAGDPQQLGPVCLSKNADKYGLGVSLMERLKLTYPNLYGTETRPDHHYITMLVNNFRSDPDILEIPNKLYYEDQLKALAEPDPLSKVSILDPQKADRAIVFHGLNSMEQRMGNAPSIFNEKELQMVRRYITALIDKHNVEQKHIGVIAPYARQVFKIKGWLMEKKYDDIEVGTVEAFQGKEKRVILISTVRANCKLLDFDAKYGLGFLVDRKRFNVALTRAKAKLIVIGNPACLRRDERWRMFMDKCRSFNTYLGIDTEQIERTSQLLTQIAITNFERCRLMPVMKEKDKDARTGKNLPQRR